MMKNIRSFPIILLLLAFLAGCSKREPAVIEGHDVQFRVSSFQPYADWTESKIVGTNDIVYVGSDTILTGPDLFDVFTGTNESGKNYVSVRVWPEAAIRLRKFTKAHLNRRMAIMVDGQVYRSLRITSPFGETFIVDNLNFDEAIELCELITGRVIMN